MKFLICALLLRAVSEYEPYLESISILKCFQNILMRGKNMPFRWKINYPKNTKDIRKHFCAVARLFVTAFSRCY